MNRTNHVPLLRKKMLACVTPCLRSTAILAKAQISAIKVTGYGLNGRGVDSRHGQEIFSSRRNPDCLCPIDTVGFPSGVKWSDRESDQSS